MSDMTLEQFLDHLGPERTAALLAKIKEVKVFGTEANVREEFLVEQNRILEELATLCVTAALRVCRFPIALLLQEMGLHPDKRDYIDEMIQEVNLDIDLHSDIVEAMRQLFLLVPD